MGDIAQGPNATTRFPAQTIQNISCHDIVKANQMSVGDGGEFKAKLSTELYGGLAGFRLAMRRFLAFSETALAEADVTSQQYQAMLVIKTASAGRVMMRELSEQMLMQRHGAVQLVDRLASTGLVERIPSEDDKRSVLIGLTAKGEQVLETLARTHVDGLLANQPLLVESLSKLRDLGELG